MLKYIDSHAHYYSHDFDEDRDELLPRLYESGVHRIINIGCSVKSSIKCAEMAEKAEYLYNAAGIHPEYANDVEDDYKDIIREICTREKTVALGEIGLDYHYEGYDRDKQIKLFREQLEMAQELQLPVVIHSRDAAADTMDILKEYKPKGVLHCYSGSAEYAKEIIRLGMYIGFTGVLTFKNAKKAVETVKTIPLDRILVETDCPYMAPEPFRGKRSDSGMIVKVLEKIAELKGISAEEAAEITMENTYRLFEKLR